MTNTLGLTSGAQFVMNGTMVCPTGALSPSCFGLAVCPDFSSCIINAGGLNVFSNVSMSGLQVTYNSMTFASPSPYSSTVTFGDSSVVGNRLAAFTEYAVTTKIDAVSLLALRALFGQVFIGTGANSSSNTITLSAPSSSITGTAATGISWITSNGAAILSAVGASLTLTSSSATFSGVGSIMNLISPNVTMTDPNTAGIWFKTNPASTMICNGTGNGLIPGSNMLGSSEIGAGVDFIASSIRSRNNGGIVNVSGINLFCNTVIQTQNADPLRLQNSPTDIIDIRGIITNGFFTTALIFNDPQGIDLQNTFLFDSTGGGVVVSDSVGLSIDNGNGTTSVSQLYTNKISSLGPGTANLTVTAPFTIFSGDVVVLGSVSAIGACCTSDKRVKRNIVQVDATEDLDTILRMPRRVRFSYTDEFLQTSRFTRNHTYEGFIAQELEAANFPTLVETHDSYVLRNGKELKDFRSVKLEYAVPYLVGAVNALNDINVAQKKELNDIRNIAMESQNKFYAMEKVMLEMMRLIISNKK